ncbi:hypothetical protein DTO212C5_5043 [Paecilomyces variotii]|nr:hypothetical protein DTO212C5_5043 [Paecilomyces variotii]
MGTLSFFIGLLAIFLPLCSAASQDNFNLFAYGDNIGGLPLVFRDGYAQVGDPNKLNSSFTKIYFDTNSSTSQWVANPNNTDSSANATWSNQVLFVPGPSSSDHRIGFASDPGSNVTTTFKTYGQFVFVVNTTGEWESAFYAQSTDTENLYSLLWNPGDSEDYIPVTLRTVAPSNFQDSNETSSSS